MGDNLILRNKKGQVTIFIIMAIVIVVLGVLIYTFFPQIKSSVGLETKDPYSFMRSCMQDKIEDVVMNLSLQGGSLNPENTYLYQGYDIEYLCYTNEDYKLCSVQRPFLKKHIESEIKTTIEQDVSSCFNSLKENYRNKGYSVNLKPGAINVELLPKRIVTKLESELTISKDSSEKYDEFDIILNNNLYELLGIATSIVEWEATLGEADTTTYMMLYPDLKVEKLRQNDETKIYILTDKNTGYKFQFASRSLAFPPGY
jgi:hypothetical protein